MVYTSEIGDSLKAQTKRVSRASEIAFRTTKQPVNHEKRPASIMMINAGQSRYSAVALNMRTPKS